MKKILAMLVALTMLVGGLGISAIAEEETANDYKIGILAPAVTHGWVAAVAYYAEQRCQELGLDYTVATSNNAEEMTTQLSDLLVWGADAIVAFPQWEGMEDPIQEAVDAGVIVVNFDIDIAVDGVYKVTGDNYGMGVAGAEYIVDKIGTEGTVVALTVPTSGSVNDLRMQGFTDTMAEIAPDIVIKEYATQFTREAGLADMADILTAEPEIDAVYSLDDETSIGALQAIDESGRTDVKVITGGGGCQEYFNMMPEYENIWVCSATYSPDMITHCVENVAKILAGEEVEHNVVIPTTIVDRDNVEEFLNPDSPY